MVLSSACTTLERVLIYLCLAGLLIVAWCNSTLPIPRFTPLSPPTAGVRR